MNECLIFNEDCIETMKRMPAGLVDLVVTSPPYDDLRAYNGYSFDFESTARSLFNVVKEGGVVVWVVKDMTVKGSETGTSFKHALFFISCGFRLHDTMIWSKTNPTPTDPRHPRYTDAFEYMFIFSKGKPSDCKLLRIECKTAGRKRSENLAANPSQLKVDGSKRTDRALKRAGAVTHDTKIRSNVWAGSIQIKKTGHPASFPDWLAIDHILSWSNPGQIVYDPFMGSGTTAEAALKNGRNVIGSEISSEYCHIIEDRLKDIDADKTFYYETRS